MPSGDGSGPKSEGPMTGWGNGYCAIPGEVPRKAVGRGSGMGCGRGPVVNIETLIDTLERNKQNLEERINELKGQ